MSGWDSYINSLTEASPCIERAAIVGVDGSVWARTEGDKQFAATEAELKTLVTGFNAPEKVPARGADLEQIHYVVPRADEAVIFGKRDKTGFFAAKSQKAVLIAIYKGDSAEGSTVRTAVEKLAEYLSSTGY
ncbi:unnamed protein product, partial [Mesorhabditis spiculigera]